MPLGISDHFLVCLVRKAHYGSIKIITTWSFKEFDKEAFLNDVEQKQWKTMRLASTLILTKCRSFGTISFWIVSINLPLAPLKMKRIGSKKSSWITYELVRKMRKRYILKRRLNSKDQSYWAAFKAARNEVNNSIKYAKRIDDNLAANRKIPPKHGS